MTVVRVESKARDCRRRLGQLRWTLDTRSPIIHDQTSLYQMIPPDRGNRIASAIATFPFQKGYSAAEMTVPSAFRYCRSLKPVPSSVGGNFTDKTWSSIVGKQSCNATGLVGLPVPYVPVDWHNDSAVFSNAQLNPISRPCNVPFGDWISSFQSCRGEDHVPSVECMLQMS